MSKKATINASALGIKKPVEINETIGIFEENLKFQIKIAELQVVTDETTEVEFLKNQLQIIEEIKTYITSFLKLTPAQSKAFSELSREEMTELGQSISAGIMHLDEDPEDGEQGNQ